MRNMRANVTDKNISIVVKFIGMVNNAFESKVEAQSSTEVHHEQHSTFTVTVGLNMQAVAIIMKETRY